MFTLYDVRTNISGTFYYLCSILDGCSRYIVNWDLRESTPREQGIVAAAVAGHSDKGIADLFKISEDVVRHHLSNIYYQLSVSTGVGVVRVNGRAP